MKTENAQKSVRDGNSRRQKRKREKGPAVSFTYMVVEVVSTKTTGKYLPKHFGG